MQRFVVPSDGRSHLYMNSILYLSEFVGSELGCTHTFLIREGFENLTACLKCIHMTKMQNFHFMYAPQLFASSTETD